MTVCEYLPTVMFRGTPCMMKKVIKSCFKIIMLNLILKSSFPQNLGFNLVILCKYNPCITTERMSAESGSVENCGIWRSADRGDIIRVKQLIQQVNS